ncbi:outer membrane protein TolC [Oxalobacteraceae bacterium GrIS 2.11]
MTSLFKTRLRVRVTGLCTFALLFCPSTQALSADSLLTLAQAQNIALTRSRQLASQDLSVYSSQEMAIAAGQLPDPVLKLGIDNLPVTGADRLSLTNDFMTMRRVGVMQELTSTDKRHARAELYERAADKARAEKTVTIAAIQRDTALAWLDRFYAEKMLATIKEQIAQNRLEIEAARSAYRSGRTSQSDLLSAHSALVLMEDRASEIQQKSLKAMISLARWIGNAADVEPDDLPAMDTVRLDPAMLDSQLEHHPEIAVLNQQINLAQADARLAQANISTDWSVGLAYQQRGPAYSNMISIELSIPIQWDQKNRQNRELYARQAVVEQATAERDELLRQHVAETRAMLTEWQNDRDRIHRFEAELLPLATERIQAMQAAYRGGKASLLEILAARRDEIDVRLQLLQLQNDTARLWAQLNFLTPAESAAVMNKERP